jgi:hypothetical protein
MRQRPKKSFNEIYPLASKAAIELLESLLVFHPDRRVHIEDALFHEYFDGIKAQGYLSGRDEEEYQPYIHHNSNRSNRNTMTSATAASTHVGSSVDEREGGSTETERDHSSHHPNTYGGRHRPNSPHSDVTDSDGGISHYGASNSGMKYNRYPLMLSPEQEKIRESSLHIKHNVRYSALPASLRNDLTLAVVLSVVCSRDFAFRSVTR